MMSYTVHPIGASQFEFFGERACTAVCCSVIEYFFKIGCSIEPNTKELLDVLQQGCQIWNYMTDLHKDEMPSLLNPHDVLRYGSLVSSYSSTLCVQEEMNCVFSRRFSNEQSGMLKEFGVSGILEVFDRMTEIADAQQLHTGIAAVFITQGGSYCIWITEDDRAWLFDSHRRNKNTGTPDPHGEAVLLSFLTSEMVIDYLEASYGVYNSVTSASTLEECDIQHLLTSVYIITPKRE